MKLPKSPEARRLQAPSFRAYLLMSLVLLPTLAALPCSTQAAWLPPAQLTDGDASSLLPLNHARCFAAGDSDKVYLVWYDDRDGDYDIYCKYFNGSSWAPEVCVTSNSSVSESPCIALDGAGKLHLVWSDYEDGTAEIYYKVYDGIVWSSATKLSDGGADAQTPVVAADQGGNVHVVWREYRSGHWALYYRRFAGTTWSTAEALTPTGAYPRFPSITADGGGSLHLVWQDARISTNSEIYYRRHNGTAWEAEERLTDSAGLSEYPSVTADSVGKIHVFWDDNRGGTAAIYHRVNDGIGWSADEVIATDADDLIGPSGCAGGGADLHVVWYKRGSAYWKRVYYRRFDGAVWLPPEEVAQAQGSNLNPCIASHSNGRVDFVWQDTQDGDSEIWWRFCQESAPTPVLLSIAPNGWLACETPQVLMSGGNFVYGMQAWLAKEGEDSIPATNVTAPSPTALSCDFDLGPAALGYWDVVIEVFDGGKDTLQAGFLVEQSIWSDDVRLTADPDSSELALGNATKVAIDSQGAIHVVWSDNRDGQREIYYKRCDGDTWGPDTRLTTSAGSSVTPAVAVDSADRLHVVWSDDRDGNWEIYYKQYDGVSWGADQRLTSAARSSQYPTIAVDSNDKLYVVWQDDRVSGGHTSIYVKRFNGSAWESDQPLLSTVYPNCTPAIAADGAGNVHVVWYEEGWDVPGKLEYRKFNGVAWETADTLVSAWRIWTPSIAVGPDGSVHICWHDKRYSDEEGSYEIFYKRYDGLAWGPDVRLTEAQSYSENASVAVAPDGVVHVVWADWRWGNAEIYHSYCDETGWTLNGRLTRAADRSDRPSVACDAEGNLHVVWTDRRDGNCEIYYKTSRAGTLAGVDGDAMSADQIGGQVCRLAVSPNPATSGAVLRFMTRQDARVRLSLYDVRGRLVWTHDAGRKVPGPYEIPWDGCDSWGRAVSPGTYFVRLTSDREKALTKVVVVK